MNSKLFMNILEKIKNSPLTPENHRKFLHEKLNCLLVYKNYQPEELYEIIEMVIQLDRL